MHDQDRNCFHEDRYRYKTNRCTRQSQILYLLLKTIVLPLPGSPFQSVLGGRKLERFCFGNRRTNQHWLRS